MGQINLLTVFLTGLLTGGLTCMAVQGGLLAATIAQREEERLKEGVKKGNALPIISFLATKLIAYTLFGFFLGTLGSVLQLSVMAQVMMQIAVVIFMIGTAMNLLEIHPIFRYFALQPPRFLTRLVRKQSKSNDVFAPAILGAFTVFIPCGTTQAMMALAIASSSALLGGAIMFAFVLGTSPIFFLLGYFATKLGDKLHQGFLRVAAVAIILLALFNLNNAVALAGSSYTVESLWTSFYCTASYCDTPVYSSNDVTIHMTSSGYTPGTIAVKAGEPVKLKLVNETGQGCVQAFTIPSLNIQKIVPVGSSSSITFTPKQPGQLAFMCSMGMYRGVINVI